MYGSALVSAINFLIRAELGSLTYSSSKCLQFESAKFLHRPAHEIVKVSKMKITSAVLV